MSNSTYKTKPKKPYPEFPLFPHATKRWAKKILGRLYYFGPWNDPTGSLNKYLEQQNDLHAGRRPRQSGDGLSVRDLCNQFLTNKRHLVDTRALSPRTFADYHKTCELVVDCFGRHTDVSDLRPTDFERLKMSLPKSWGPMRLKKTIVMARSIFKYAMDQDLTDKLIKFGEQFRPPTKKTVRIHRAKTGKRMFDAKQIHAMIEQAGPQVKAMILLAVNCGFGNNDIATLPKSAVDINTGWIQYPRPKTGVDRRCPLWPETIAALRPVMAETIQAKNENDRELVFLTAFGAPWVKVRAIANEDGTLKVNTDDAISKEIAKITKAIGISRRGMNFYAIRHTFRTVADEAKDQPAANLIMGHADDSMADIYRESISDERLRAVVATVRQWLFGKGKRK